jgi:protein-S-isoprenylcysteine O-methyltransferase Ste14
MIDAAYTKPRILPPKGLLIAIAAQTPLLVSGWPLHPSATEITAGAMFVIAGIVANVWSEKLFRTSDVGVCPFTHVPVLIARGPYRLTRNPMYVGLVCLNVGLTLMSGVLANVWSSIAFWIWLHYEFVRPEEDFLRQELGGSYDQYAAQVARWVPLNRPLNRV